MTCVSRRRVFSCSFLVSLAGPQIRTHIYIYIYTQIYVCMYIHTITRVYVVRAYFVPEPRFFWRTPGTYANAAQVHRLRCSSWPQRCPGPDPAHCRRGACPKCGTERFLVVLHARVCLYVRLSVCISVCMSVCSYVCMYVCIGTYIHTYIERDAVDHTYDTLGHSLFVYTFPELALFWNELVAFKSQSRVITWVIRSRPQQTAPSTSSQRSCWKTSAWTYGHLIRRWSHSCMTTLIEQDLSWGEAVRYAIAWPRYAID